MSEVNKKITGLVVIIVILLLIIAGGAVFIVSDILGERDVPVKAAESTTKEASEQETTATQTSSQEEKAPQVTQTQIKYDPVLYISAADGYLYLKNALDPTCAPTQLCEGREDGISAGKFYVNKDGTQIIYSGNSQNEEAREYGYFNIYLYDIVSGTSMPIAEDITDYEASEDLSHVFYVKEIANEDYRWELYEYVKGNITKIVDDVSSYWITPDGKRLTYTTPDGGIYFKEEGKTLITVGSQDCWIDEILLDQSGIYYTQAQTLKKFTPDGKTADIVSFESEYATVMLNQGKGYIFEEVNTIYLEDMIEDDKLKEDIVSIDKQARTRREIRSYIKGSYYCGEIYDMSYYDGSTVTYIGKVVTCGSVASWSDNYETIFVTQIENEVWNTVKLSEISQRFTYEQVIGESFSGYTLYKVALEKQQVTGKVYKQGEAVASYSPLSDSVYDYDEVGGKLIYTTGEEINTDVYSFDLNILDTKTMEAETIENCAVDFFPEIINGSVYYAIPLDEYPLFTLYKDGEVILDNAELIGYINLSDEGYVLAAHGTEKKYYHFTSEGELIPLAFPIDADMLFIDTTAAGTKIIGNLSDDYSQRVYAWTDDGVYLLSEDVSLLGVPYMGSSYYY